MALDLEYYKHVKTESAIASSVGPGKSLYLIVVTDGLDVNYEVRNNKKVLYSGKSSYAAAQVFNDTESKYMA
jgi:hypothetical protein